jgi:hypothetical protein
MKFWLLFALPAWLSFVVSTPASEDPRLSITNIPGAFVVSWPATATDWVLEQSPHLRAPIPWGAVSSAWHQSNALNRFVTLPTENASRFFRLRQGPPNPALDVPGLTGAWRLDEGLGQSSADATGSGPALSLANTAWATGRFGSGALAFNGGGIATGGSRAWVSNMAYRVLPSPGRPFSVSLWFAPQALPLGSSGLIGNDMAGSNGWRLTLNSTGPGTNYLIFAGTGESSLNVTGRTLLLPNVWRQLTLTHNGVEGSIYLDSVLLGRGAGNLPTHDGPIWLGGVVGDLASFLGRIDEVRTYTNALTHDEISLNGHWRFNENGGGFALDSSLQGRPARVADGAGWAPAREGSGIDLNVGGFVIANDEFGVLPASGGSFSLSFWLRPNLSNGLHPVMKCGEGAIGGWELAIERESSGEAWLQFASTNNGGTLDLRAPVALTNDLWTKLEVTYNGGIATAYANGRRIEARNGAIRGSRGLLVAGTALASGGFGGIIDDLKIWNRERDPSEIGPVAATMWETVLVNSTTNLHLQGSGPAGKSLTYSILPLITPTNGSVAASGGSATYSAAGRKGPDAFAYTVSDGEFTSDPAIVSLSVVEPHWLSPNGGLSVPRDGTSPARAWVAGTADALDAIWKTNNYYDCLFYAPGEYQTRGHKYLERSTANTGCKHIGSGSSGAEQTALKLVESLDSTAEELIFSPSTILETCNGFEVHHMALDCNADNLPKYVRGEPMVIRIPLASTDPVDTVTLQWKEGPGGAPATRFGKALEFSVSTRSFTGSAYATNRITATSTGQVDVVALGTAAEELIIQLDQRAPGVDFYGLAEINVAGAAVSLPTAMTLQGLESRLDSEHSIIAAVDGNPGTAWASGPESETEIVLPLSPNTAVSQLHLNWNCKMEDGVGRLGPAAQYQVRARNEDTGEYFDVPITRHPPTSLGLETATFGTPQLTNSILTDRLVIRLIEKGTLVDFFSISEVTLRNGFVPVALRLPFAEKTLHSGPYSILRAFDQESETHWASPTQGMVGAISAFGSNLKFTNLRVVGFGTKAGRECFAMSIFSPGFRSKPIRHGNVLVENCILTEPARNNTDGLTVLMVLANAQDILTNAIVRRCTVRGMKSHFRDSKGLSAVHAENCLIEDCQIGLYFEPDGANVDHLGPVLIRSNQFVNVISGLYILSLPGAQMDSVSLLDNEIVLSGEGGWGLATCDTCSGGQSGSITNVTARNNIVRFAGWLPHPTRSDGGLHYGDMHHAIFANNVIALGTPSALRTRQCPAGLILPPPPVEDCDFHDPGPIGPPTYPPCVDVLLPGYRRAWFGNRDLSGTHLNVRFWNNNADGLATQQQWTE